MSVYGWLLLAVLFFPVLLSFDRKVGFVRKWGITLLSALPAAAVFIPWDVTAASIGAWGFNPAFVFRFRLFGLPAEELLFFLAVPFACVFVYECFRCYLPRLDWKNGHLPPLLLTPLLLALLPFAWGRFYSFTILATGAVVSALLATAGAFLSRDGRFWIALLVCYLPFAAANGVLTALPVVTYAPQSFSGVRAVTIPLEDFLYTFALLVPTFLVYELLRRRGEAKAAA